MWSFSWDKHWRAVRKGFSAVCPSLHTLLDGGAASICGCHGRPQDRAAAPTNVCCCNCVHSRQTHAVTFWLCSSIVVAIFVTFWNYSLFENRHWISMVFWNGSQAVTEELIIVYRLDIGVAFLPFDTGPWSQGPSLYDHWGAVWAMQAWNHHPHWFIYHCQAVCCHFKSRATQPPALVCHVCCVHYPWPVKCILKRGSSRNGVTSCVERGGLVTGERSRPVFGLLWVLKLCIGAFSGVPQPENICFGFQDAGECIYE